jgi:hypothetical protein
MFHRHNKHLQVLPGYGTFVAASHEASKSVPVVVSPPPRASATTSNAVQEQLQQRLHSCDVSLPDGVDKQAAQAERTSRLIEHVASSLDAVRARQDEMDAWLSRLVELSSARQQAGA